MSSIIFTREMEYNKKQQKQYKYYNPIFIMKGILELVTFLTFVCSRDICHANNCVTFSVSSGTGCAWMCDYCATNLGTNNYYFTDGVCTYDAGTGCVGNPIAGKSYTCCSV
jgi:hypothetical protein